MVAPIKSHPAGHRELALPIHPCVTLEDWVGASHIALIDGELGPREQALLIESIERDPATAALFRQACEDEALLRACYAQALGANARPVTVG